jgi:predicted HTH transcriptional regulator
VAPSGEEAPNTQAAISGTTTGTEQTQKKPEVKPTNSQPPLQDPQPKAESKSEGEGILIQSRRQEIGLRYIQEHGAITNMEYRNLTGVSESTAMRDLEVLVEQGTLRAVGKRRGRKYLRF